MRIYDFKFADLNKPVKKDRQDTKKDQISNLR